MSQYKPGQILNCTVTKMPRATGHRDTIARLMRRDPASKKALANAQRKRRQRMVVYNRGNRDWVSRETCAKVVHVVRGESWTMPFTFDILPELNLVSKYLTIKSA